MGTGFSFQELLIILVIGLVVLGPERLPRVANQLGSWLGKARRMTRVMKRQLEDELNFEKDFEILPPDRTRHTPTGAYQPPSLPGNASGHPPLDDDADPPEEKPDDYSPAHGVDEPGTGVGDAVTAESDDAGAAGEDGATDDDRKAGP